MRRFERTTQVAIIMFVAGTMMVSAIGCLTPQGEIDMDATEQALRDYGPLAATLLGQYLDLRRLEVQSGLSEIREVGNIIADIVAFAETLIPAEKSGTRERIAELSAQARRVLEAHGGGDVS